MTPADGHAPDGVSYEIDLNAAGQAREEARQLKASIEAFARIVNVLTAENDRLTQQQTGKDNRNLIPLRPGTS